MKTASSLTLEAAREKVRIALLNGEDTAELRVIVKRLQAEADREAGEAARLAAEQARAADDAIKSAARRIVGSTTARVAQMLEPLR
jgi:hypothetical protein